MKHSLAHLQDFIPTLAGTTTTSQSHFSFRVTILFRNASEVIIVHHTIYVRTYECSYVAM